MRLLEFKKYLDDNTAKAMFSFDESQSRYLSFKICLEYLPKVENPEVLELGTCRSFVDGAFEGCNSDDTQHWNKYDISRWDWGAGCFGLVFGLNGCNLTTVDIVKAHIERSKVMTSSLGIKCDSVVSDSLEFLRNTDKKFNLIYLDTGDMWPVEDTSKLQLEEARIICERTLLVDGGFILIDDVKNKTPREYGDVDNTLGKSKYSLDYLRLQGFKVIYAGYQYILTKNV